nr:unnamed protein product [Callosobruchus analis]
MLFSKMSKATICNVISEVCAAIVEALCDYVKTPSTEEEWLSIAEEFKDKWNFPNCVGAIDGKHCIIQAPIKSGSNFFNYKSTFSIVLMTVVDANYNFIFADVCCQGRISDGADDAFPLQRHIMKPYAGTHAKGSPKRIYNYRLSRARRIVENAFGILSAVFRVLRKPMLLQPDKASLIAMTCIYLHNYLMKRKASRILYNSSGMMDRTVDGITTPGQWRCLGPSTSFLPLLNTGRRHAMDCDNIRQEFSEYFNNTDCLSW